MTNVKIKFNHKLVSSRLDEGVVHFEKYTHQLISSLEVKFKYFYAFGSVKTGDKVSARVDLICGTDGAYSSIRKEFMKKARFNYSQV